MKKITHVIFIAYQPITLKFRKDFYIKTLMDEGFEIEYWNLSKLYKKYLNTDEPPDKIVVHIASYQQLKKD